MVSQPADGADVESTGPHDEGLHPRHPQLRQDGVPHRHGRPRRPHVDLLDDQPRLRPPARQRQPPHVGLRREPAAAAGGRADEAAAAVRGPHHAARRLQDDPAGGRLGRQRRLALREPGPTSRFRAAAQRQHHGAGVGGAARGAAQEGAGRSPSAPRAPAAPVGRRPGRGRCRRATRSVASTRGSCSIR